MDIAQARRDHSEQILIMKKVLFSLTALLFLTLAGSASASGITYGGYGVPCQPIYGGGEVCISKGNIIIDKTVQNPNDGQFVDNLALSNDYRFKAGQDVIFQLKIANTGDKDFSEVEVRDEFPNYLDFIAGPGSYNSETKTLTFKITDLKAGESEVFNLVARVTSASSLPADRAVSCVLNQVRATSGDNKSTDHSQICIEQTIATTKGGLPVMKAPPIKETPATGPEMLSLFGLIPAGAAGFYLRRKVSR